MPPKKNVPKKNTSTNIKPTINNEQQSNTNSNPLTNSTNTGTIPSSSSSSSNINYNNNTTGNTKLQNRNVKHHITESAEDLSGKTNIEILTI